MSAVPPGLTSGGEITVDRHVDLRGADDAEVIRLAALNETLVIFVVRTAASPWTSLPSGGLTVGVAGSVAVGVLRPFTPLAPGSASCHCRRCSSASS